MILDANAWTLATEPQQIQCTGTPVTGTKQITAHVLAKRLDTFECEQRYLVITLAGDERYDRATQQVIDIHVENIEAEYLLSDRNDLTGKLVNSVKEAFRGKDVYPYVYCIQPGKMDKYCFSVDRKIIENKNKSALSKYISFRRKPKEKLPALIKPDGFGVDFDADKAECFADFFESISTSNNINASVDLMGDYPDLMGDYPQMEDPNWLEEQEIFGILYDWKTSSSFTPDDDAAPFMFGSLRSETDLALIQKAIDAVLGKDQVCNSYHMGDVELRRTGCVTD
ncbi:unnamed protein product [Haemonchus placei]|uniref:Phage protein n=1 Tax=Haemonchus placei TaxID=6290 RepID=A0A0N4WN19_HAEPC|nr:unnamed protein product [Haemonchus placei]